jgi:hypothetical protein
MLSGTGLEKHGPHRWPLAFVIDDGNSYKGQIREGIPVLLKAFPHVAAIDFLADTNVGALQAADVLTWAVRRDLSGAFSFAFAPLRNLFDQYHLKMNYEEEWMKGVADRIRA